MSLSALSRGLSATFFPAIVAAAAIFTAPSTIRAQAFEQTFGPLFSPARTPEQTVVPYRLAVDALRRWNRIAIDASGLDHTPVPPGSTRVFGEQVGPGRAARAMALVHIAMADVVSATTGRFASFTNVTTTAPLIVTDIAISQAAHDTLVALYPSQAGTFDTALLEDLQSVRGNTAPVLAARDLGQRAATAIIAMRANDGVAIPEPLVGTGHATSNAAGHWRQDPISLIPLALGAHWGKCTPFVLPSVSMFRTPPPPAMSSADYTTAYNEVKSLGGDGITTPTQRTAEQAFIGVFWAYDGTPSLCAPPRLYNQIAMQIADQRNLNTEDLARLLALTNLAMAETGYTAWESKFFWDFWRPIGGIRESDPGSGPTGTGDGNPNTIGDPTFMPLGAPASNLTGPNFTPPFPAYPSGHAAFGGALFQTLRRFFNTDKVGFTFVSDEFNGITRDNNGVLRPYIPRTFRKLSHAEEENGQSRIYLGIHWSFDKTAGIVQGRQVADYIYDRAFLPTP